MAHPKRQHSRQRQRKRRGDNEKASVPSFAECSQCKKAIIPHRVCPFCGYYKGKPVLEIKEKAAAE